MFLAFCSVGVRMEKMGVRQQNNCMSPYNTGENLLSSFSFETGFIYEPREPSQGRFHCFEAPLLNAWSYQGVLLHFLWCCGRLNFKRTQL